MNEKIPTSEPKPVKPCRKCGEADRYANGACAPCARKNSGQWAKNNPQKKKKWSKQNYAKNKSKIIQDSVAWARANPDKTKKYYQNWKKKNPDKYKENKARQAHARRNAKGRLSKGIIQQLMKKQNNLCACCNAPLNGKFHLDHILPIALGGCNADNNVQLLLPKCNLTKGARHPDDYMKMKDRNNRDKS